MFPVDWTCIETAHRAGRPTGLVGYPVSLGGTLKVAFSLSGEAKLTVTSDDNAACIVDGEQSSAIAILEIAAKLKNERQRMVQHLILS